MKQKSKLHKEIENALEEKAYFGHSRHKAKQDGSDQEKIFSYGTMKQYKRQCRLFADYVKERNQKAKHTSQAKKYAEDYLNHLIEIGRSPSTIQTARSALSKLYGETVAGNLDLPKKTRDSITNNRLDCQHLKRFSEKKNAELVNFCKKTGLRKHELKALQGDDLIQLDGKYYIHVRRGKGGKERFVEIYEQDELVIQRMRQTPAGVKVWTKNNGWKECCPAHRYRADYAAALYHFYARDVSQLGKHEKYFCRNDERGKVYDRQALKIVSENLGHNRINVIPVNYGYKI